MNMSLARTLSNSRVASASVAKPNLQLVICLLLSITARCFGTILSARNDTVIYDWLEVRRTKFHVVKADEDKLRPLLKLCGRHASTTSPAQD